MAFSEQFRIGVLGVIVIGVLELVALLKGYNGVSLAAAVGVIGSICGWYTHKARIKFSQEERKTKDE